MHLFDPQGILNRQRMAKRARRRALLLGWVVLAVSFCFFYVMEAGLQAVGR